jgi:hypothetical protein
MVRTYLCRAVIAMLVAALPACASTSPEAVCGTPYAVVYEAKVPSIDGSGRNTFTVQEDTAAGRYVARVINPDNAEVILSVKAGPDRDSLISYGSFGPLGVKRAVVPRLQGQAPEPHPGESPGRANDVVYVCGGRPETAPPEVQSTLAPAGVFSGRPGRL